ncbi:MAG: NAD-binding protein [Chloroflexi bacterium]|nr:NAD-binding protein [Chloroflexota bacterium]
MFVLIVGGGNAGSHLAEILLAQGHKVRVMDNRPEIISRLHSELPTEVIVTGDGTDPVELEAAGIREANVLAAVLADDEANLVATSLARFHYGVRRTIARVNTPRNAWLFTPDMGVDVALDNADLMAKLIAEEMSLGDMMVMLKLRKGEFALVEEKLPPRSRAIGVMIKDLSLPPEVVIAAIFRKGKVVIPRGVTTLEAGDEVLAVVNDANANAVAQLFGDSDGVVVTEST